MQEFEKQQNIQNPENIQTPQKQPTQTSQSHTDFSVESQKSRPLPPPTVIERVKVDKVYEECKQVDVNEITFDLPAEFVNNELIDVECLDVYLHPRVECTIPNNGLVRTKFWYWVLYSINNQKAWHGPIEFTKTVRLQRAGERGLKPQCEVFLECLDAFVLDNQIVLCIGKLILFKLFAHVQLLIPAYGFAPQPPECPPEPLEECPEFDPEWPPYPPQE